MGKKTSTKDANKKNIISEKEKDSMNATNSAKSIAEAMVANMAANQNDAEFEKTKDEINAEAADYALKKHAKTLAQVGIQIPGYTDNLEPKEKQKDANQKALMKKSKK